MGRIQPTSLAHRRHVFAKDPTAARGRFNIGDSITNWCLALVRGQDPARLPPASEALAGVGGACQRFRECQIASLLPLVRESCIVANDGVCQKPSLACTWQPITVQNGPIQTGSPGVPHSFRGAGSSCLKFSMSSIKRDVKRKFLPSTGGREDFCLEIQPTSL